MSRSVPSVQNSGALSSAPSLDEVRQQTGEMVGRAAEAEGTILVEAPIASGKTTGAADTIAELAERGESSTYLPPREDLYNDMEACLDARDVDNEYIPRFTDCPTYQGEQGLDWQEEFETRYSFGATAWELHHELDAPCMPNCPYMEEARRFDRDDFEAIIGYQNQAYAKANTEGRFVFLDEFDSSAFETAIEQPNEVITRFLERHDGLPYADSNDLLSGRHDHDREKVALEWFAEHGAGPDSNEALAEEKPTHALAPYLTFALLRMKDLGNGFEVFPLTTLPEYGIEKKRYCVWNRKRDAIHVLTPPDLSDAKAVVALDATPTKRMWDLVCDTDFEHWQLLNGDETKNAYVKDTLNTTVKQAGRGAKHYSSGQVTPDRDAAILMGIEAKEGTKPAVVAPKKALREYKRAGIRDCAGEAMNYGKVLSNGAFEGERLGFVSGSLHPGDEVIKRWGAYLDEAVERDGEGMGKDYGAVGNEIYRHFVHRQTLQAMLRFGRDEEPTTVYLNTRAIPDWLEVDVKVKVRRALTSEKRREVAQFLKSLGDAGATRKAVIEETEVSERTVRRALDELHDAGYVSRDDQPGPYGDLWRWDP